MYHWIRYTLCAISILFILNRADAAACIISYQVETAPAANGPWTQVGTVPGTASSMQVTVTNAGAHYYHVIALLQDGSSVVSNSVLVTAYGVPLKPFNLQLMLANAEVSAALHPFVQRSLLP